MSHVAKAKEGMTACLVARHGAGSGPPRIIRPYSPLALRTYPGVCYCNCICSSVPTWTNGSPKQTYTLIRYTL